MKGVFVFLVDGELKTYNDFKDIPEKFDNIIKFFPEIPGPPHSEQQHEEIEKWNTIFLDLLKKETNGR